MNLWWNCSRLLGVIQSCLLPAFTSLVNFQLLLFKLSSRLLPSREVLWIRELQLRLMCHHHFKYFKNRLDTILCNLRPYVHLWRIWSLVYSPAEGLSNLGSTWFSRRTLPAQLAIFLMAGTTAVWICISASLLVVTGMWVAAVFSIGYSSCIFLRKSYYLLGVPDEEYWVVVHSPWVIQPPLQLFCLISSFFSCCRKYLINRMNSH